jgi:hypothetical protein
VANSAHFVAIAKKLTLFRIQNQLADAFCAKFVNITIKSVPAIGRESHSSRAEQAKTGMMHRAAGKLA